jgi:L-threonylcarbamoyladenylate synthase
MKTTIYQIEDLNRKDVQNHIHHILNNQGLVVFPTETVYGIGASAIDALSVKHIFLAKGRPSDNPLIVHISNPKDLIKYVEKIPTYANLLIKNFWPGPLTMIFKKNPIIPDEVTGGLDSVGIRMPNHNIALKVIDIAKIPICAPSANLSGKPSSTEFNHVKADFLGKVDIIIDGGKTSIGIESTVLDLSLDIPAILRPGYVTKEMIEEVLGIEILDLSETKVKETPKSPGMKYKHYAPKGHVSIIKGDLNAVVSYINFQATIIKDQKIGVIAPTEYIHEILIKDTFDLGPMGNLDLIGSNIFSALRQMDLEEIDIIYIPYLSTKKLGSAIMNRLIKAANHEIIEL